MQLFDILQDGFHTPLSEEQIVELFQTGRLNRHTRCKLAEEGAWRTIDELFPLLKYHAPWRLGYESPQSSSEFRFRRAIVFGTSLVLTLAAALATYLYSQRQSPADRPITAIHSTLSSTGPSHVRHAPVITRHAQTTFPQSTPSYVFASNAGEVAAVPLEQTNRQSAIRLAEAQRIAEQARREQADAERQRQQQLEAARQQKLLEEQKAAGRDEHIPLDQWHIVDVGGEAVRVKIHDNDVTSFDVWINGQWRQQVPKAKGITHTQRDETLIYSNGRAALYYVWEISGRINHCLLRVRD